MDTEEFLRKALSQIQGEHGGGVAPEEGYRRWIALTARLSAKREVRQRLDSFVVLHEEKATHLVKAAERVEVNFAKAMTILLIGLNDWITSKPAWANDMIHHVAREIRTSSLYATVQRAGSWSNAFEESFSPASSFSWESLALVGLFGASVILLFGYLFRS